MLCTLLKSSLLVKGKDGRNVLGKPRDKEVEEDCVVGAVKFGIRGIKGLHVSYKFKWVSDIEKALPFLVVQKVVEAIESFFQKLLGYVLGWMCN